MHDEFEQHLLEYQGYVKEHNTDNQHQFLECNQKLDNLIKEASKEIEIAVPERDEEPRAGGGRNSAQGGGGMSDDQLRKFAKLSKQMSSTASQLEFLSKQTLPNMFKKLDTKIEDQMLILKNQIDKKIKHYDQKSKASQSFQSHANMTMLSNGLSGDAGAGPSSNLSMGAPNAANPHTDGQTALQSPDPEVEIDEDEMLEEEQKNKDAYTKMLIREELAEAQRATEAEIEILKDKVDDTSKYDNLDGRVEELEILFKKFHGKIDQEVVSLYAKMKIQQLMIQAVPKPKPADDPQFSEYDNLHKLVIG